MPVNYGNEPYGSQAWLRLLVNSCPILLDESVQDGVKANGLTEPFAAIDWRSPLAAAEYQEYKDKEFLTELGRSRFMSRLNRPLPTWEELNAFWPSNGPRWDGLGVTDNGRVLLVEAKSYIEELKSSMSAISKISQNKIQRSLNETKAYLVTDTSIDWTKPVYQYANRLAHLYWFHQVKRIPTYLVNIYFLNDNAMKSDTQLVPQSAAEWRAAIRGVELAMGIRPKHSLSRRIVKVFIDVGDIRNTAKANN